MKWGNGFRKLYSLNVSTFQVGTEPKSKKVKKKKKSYNNIARTTFARRQWCHGQAAVSGASAVHPMPIVRPRSVQRGRLHVSERRDVFA